MFPRIDRILHLAACTFLSFLVMSYAGLIGLGRWQLDEYVEFFHMRQEGMYLLKRLKWSPRPFSEFIYCSYGWLVNHFHHEFIVPLLGLLWLLFLAAGLLTTWQRKREGKPSRPELLITLTLLALAVSGGMTTDVFYWPAGAVAYIPTLAATLLLFLQVIEGRLETRKGRVIACICLLTAAASSETGATFVMCYALIQVVMQGAAAIRKREGARRRPLLWYVLPLVMALGVLTIVRMNRYNSNDAAPVYQATAGRPIRSLGAGAGEMVVEVIGRQMIVQAIRLRPDPRTWIHSGLAFPLEMLIGSRLAMEVLLVAGVVLAWSTNRKPSREQTIQINLLVAALLVSSLFVAAASYLHFGTICCHRHELVRENWMGMILTGAAIVYSASLSGTRRDAQAKYSTWAPLLLCTAVASLGYLRPLWRTYLDYGRLSTANSENLASGFQTASPDMTFWVLPSDGIIDKVPIPPGTYDRPPEITGFGEDVFANYLLGFFDKQQVVVRPLIVDSAKSNPSPAVK